MRHFVYAGGAVHPEFITEHPKGEDIVIAADSGYRNALLLGDKVDVLIGDFDSLGRENVPEGIQTVTLPEEKDVTDTQAAVELALKDGASEIIIIGGLSGRPDHTISNLAILEYLNRRGVHAVITDGASRARFLRNSSELLFSCGFRYFSIIAADEKVRGLSIEGCKYPINNAVLYREKQYAVSNEITGNCALISVRKGGVWILETRDI